MDPQAVNALITTASGLISTWGLKVIGAIAVLFVGRMVAGWARRATSRSLERADLDASLIPFLSSLVYFLLLTFVVLAVLGLFGVPTASLVAVLGAASLAVGLAMQGTFSNFAAGVMLLIFRPFKVGDVVQIGGTTGAVKEIGVFSTVLDTPDNVRNIVPNSAVWGQTITNFTANPIRRVDMVFGVGYGDDLQVASDTMRSIVSAHPNVLPDPPPQVEVSALADSSVNFVVRPWVRTEDYWQVKFDLTRQLKEGLEGVGCSIPFPQRDVHLYRAEA